ncbi:MAG: gephyrin-like molybdotransferase Glp [Verrucomicrobiota bacterium]
MLEESEARQRILSLIPPVTAESVRLDQAIGRYAAADVFATLPLPPFDNSAMDGYAIHDTDCGPPRLPLTIAGEQPAGPDFGLEVTPGYCVRIFTGAPLPRGTGAVVMQEDTVRSDDGQSITLTESTEPGEFIRHAGADLCVGQRLLTAGDLITPTRLAVLASQGSSTLLCGPRPRACIVTTGNELIPPGQPLMVPGQIYNSNGPMLGALLAQAGAKTTALHSPDDLPGLTQILGNALTSHDVVVLAGGVSVGDHDFVKPALEALGIPLQFWRVRMKPGKPFLFTTQTGKLIFGLPGNPASAFVTALLFVLPALRKLAGASDTGALPVTTPATLTVAAGNPGDRPHYLRGHYQYSTASFTPVGLRQSHALAALASSNALLRLAPDAVATAGSVHPVVLF